MKCASGEQVRAPDLGSAPDLSEGEGTVPLESPLYFPGLLVLKLSLSSMPGGTPGPSEIHQALPVHFLFPK